MANNEREYIEPKVIASLKDLPDGPEVQLDPSEDAWEYGAPPPAGIYKVKLMLSKDPFKLQQYDAKDPKATAIQVALDCKIVSEDKDLDGTPVFTNVSTRVFRGKNISTAAGLIVKLGFKLPSAISDKKVAQLVEAAVKKEPVITCELDWRGSFSVPNPKGGKDTWVNVFNHYADFPKAEDGSRLHIVRHETKEHGTKEVRAMVQVVRFFGKGDTIPEPGKVGLVSQPKALTLQKEEEVTLESTPTIAKAQALQPQAKKEEESDLELMLAD